MRKMNNLFAVVFTIIGVTAFSGALFCGATWHFGTAIMCAFLVIVFRAENSTSKAN
jgi:hypothetical protein